MTRSEQAAALFTEGFSCSQAVLAVYAPDFGLSRELALRISQPFGGGIAKSADWCGAATGALMVIGLRYGRVKAEDTEAKDKTYAVVQEFIRKFKARHGHLRCLNLLGCDIGTPEGQKVIESRRLHQTVCEPLVRDAVDILETLL
jgi:C_GCAxxG_C_C family probable redox protein